MAQTGPKAQYLAFLEEGRFMLQRSRASGAFHFFPRVAAPLTGDTDLEWVEASGRGTVHATTAVHRRPPAAPYNVALIDLAEGPRLMSRVDGIPAEDVQIGMAVKAKIVREEGQPLLVFEPAG